MGRGEEREREKDQLNNVFMLTLSHLKPQQLS